ncbi:PRC-barrel domain-containing protein [Roseicitreum antarcticum]|uniref:PRC-barrel domain-containing protein n=1 Tax=Roseicitreum antarcticum TaxID=564137 RepID=A0A1H2VWP0_9RHOB|nr:PRC-barrel domain-containing protein [Roseicitreum antarcticum]SDW72775.1 PRC-barrel domain-containing protein [Roseicitreum antarcticum]
MNKFMMTTALVAVTSFGTMAHADNHNTAGDTAAMSGSQTVPAFLGSNFIGKTLYTLDTEQARELRESRMGGAQDSWDTTSMGWNSDETFTGGRDAWENIGDIGDVVMTQDGEIRGILIDVGGFLGMGERTVLVDAQELYFVADETNAEDLGGYFVVSALNEADLEALPEWDAEQLNTGFEAQGYGNMTGGTDGAMGGETMNGTDDATAMAQSTEPMAEGTGGMAETDGMAAGDMAATDGTMAREPGIMPDGYVSMEPEARTADRLLGAEVYAMEGDEVANVEDLSMNEGGEVTHAIIDVGGFLGLGTRTVAIELEQLDILWNEQDGDVRVQLPMTAEQLENLPEYEG